MHNYYRTQMCKIYFLSKLPPWNKLSNAFCTLGSLRILDESFSVWLDSTDGWGCTLEERDVFNIFKIRLCSWAACGFWIVVAAGRIGTSAITKIYYCIYNIQFLVFENIIVYLV